VKFSCSARCMIRTGTLFLLGIHMLATAQAPGPRKIRLTSLPGRPLPVVAAEMNGTFAKFGIEVETNPAPNSDAMRAALAEEKADIAHAAVDNAVAMVELTGADVVIVMGGEGSLNELFVQPEIHSAAELRGKILIVDAVNTAYALQMKKILLLSGLQAGRDYEMKPYGATPQRLVAMREHKELAGSMLGPPASILAKREGFVSLGSTQKLIGAYQSYGAFVQRKWAGEHQDALVRYLAAYIEAQRWLMAPANKQKVIELMMKESKIPADVATETYGLLMEEHGGYMEDARLDLEGFRNVLKLRAEVEGQWGGHPPGPEKYYDSTYYDAALAKAVKGAK
jgi:ABC-type nitrate/sulfonate/bicarbonate transport system substrate-binding protein